MATLSSLLLSPGLSLAVRNQARPWRRRPSGRQHRGSSCHVPWAESQQPAALIGAHSAGPPLHASLASCVLPGAGATGPPLQPIASATWRGAVEHRFLDRVADRRATAPSWGTQFRRCSSGGDALVSAYGAAAVGAGGGAAPTNHTSPGIRSSARRRGNPEAAARPAPAPYSSGARRP